LKALARSLILVALMLAPPASARNKEAAESWNPDLYRRIDAIIKRSGFTGEIAIDSAASSGQTSIPAGPRPIDAPPSRAALNWRWASVTKQLIAVLVLQEVAKGTIDLDAPVGRYIPLFKSANAEKTTVRQLLRHQSGLPNPDDTATDTNGIAAYYQPNYRGSRDPLSGYCAGPVKGRPGENWSYNNCDFIVAGALLEAVTGKTWQALVQQRIARPLKLTSLKAFPTKSWTRHGTISGKDEPVIAFEAFGAAGALFGSSLDLLTFDRALLQGELLPKAQMAMLWDGQADLGFIALGQWVFEAPLQGCEKPVRIVERRGAIGGVQVRNFIVPEAKAAVAAFSDRDNFDFGEIWQGSGFSYDMLSAAICTKGLSE
jgi:D-alanyl-D-alanine carboxypeptidase